MPFPYPTVEADYSPWYVAEWNRRHPFGALPPMTFLNTLLKGLVTTLGPIAASAANTALQQAIAAIQNQINQAPSQPTPAPLVSNLMGQVSLSEHALKPDVLEAKRDIIDHILLEPTAVAKA